MFKKGATCKKMPTFEEYELWNTDERQRLLELICPSTEVREAIYAELETSFGFMEKDHYDRLRKEVGVNDVSSQEAWLMMMIDSEKFPKLKAFMARLFRIKATQREIHDDPVAWLEKICREKGCWVYTVDMPKEKKIYLV